MASNTDTVSIWWRHHDIWSYSTSIKQLYNCSSATDITLVETVELSGTKHGKDKFEIRVCNSWGLFFTIEWQAVHSFTRHWTNMNIILCSNFHTGYEQFCKLTSDASYVLNYAESTGLNISYIIISIYTWIQTSALASKLSFLSECRYIDTCFIMNIPNDYQHIK